MHLPVAEAPSRSAPLTRHRLDRWLLLAVLAPLPFGAGLAAGVLGPSTLSPSLSPVVATAVLLLGVPLWFLVAEALAAFLHTIIKARRPFVAVHAALGFGLLFLLFSLLITPWWGALISASVAAVLWWLTAARTRSVYAAAARG